MCLNLVQQRLLVIGYSAMKRNYSGLSVQDIARSVTMSVVFTKGPIHGRTNFLDLPSTDEAKSSIHQHFRGTASILRASRCRARVTIALCAAGATEFEFIQGLLVARAIPFTEDFSS